MANKKSTQRPTADIPAAPDFQSADSTTPSVPAPAASTPSVPASDVDYGMLDSLRTGQANVTEAMQKFVQKLGDYLSSALDDATSLEVRTYVSEDINGVTYEKGQFSGNARLRAMTRVNIDGDSLVCVPETDGEVDTAVWQIHMDMVRQAHESRAELMKTIVSAASSLTNLFTPKA
ncbi:MAG TPA: hypothetical protein VMT73_11875 [Anaerolineales bacterium]|nr:hypothetical protein [Anaerolineales bacterium]